MSSFISRLVVLFTIASSFTASAGASSIHVLEIDGVINPVTERYLSREIANAESEGAGLLLLRLNTPGGLESAMREMVQAILASRVPVVVHVSPPGARAASAGMFLALAAHVAAMSPGTNIGAAHPVSVSPQGSDATGEADSTLAAKSVNDVAALARSTARLRGRNSEWAERAVRRSVSITAEEALSNRVIDVIAADTSELLSRIDGRRVVMRTGEVTLRTKGVNRVTRSMGFAERILHAVTDPNVAYLLMTVGMIGIIAELYSPGMGLPGIIGTVSLLLAFVGLGSLPINLVGILLMVLAAGLFLAELMTPGFGLLALGGLLSFVVGSLMLYTPFKSVSPAAPDVRVDRGLIAVAALGMALFFLFVVRAAFRSRRLPIATGVQALVGKEGTAVSPFSPVGFVRIEGEVWSAVSESVDMAITPGDAVTVIGVMGVTLRVRRRAREAA